MAETAELLQGYMFGPEVVVAGDCDGDYPVIVFVRDRMEGDEYPQTEEDYEKYGLQKKEQATEPGCGNYQRLVELGAPVLACANCPLITGSSPPA